MVNNRKITNNKNLINLHNTNFIMVYVHNNNYNNTKKTSIDVIHTVQDLQFLKMKNYKFKSKYHIKHFITNNKNYN
jgi:hypothetical protein